MSAIPENVLELINQRLGGYNRVMARGRRSHVWEASIHDDRRRLVAAGRVRLMVLEPDAAADGETVAMQSPRE